MAVNFKSDRQSKPRGRATDYAAELAREIRDSNLSPSDTTANTLRNYYTVSTLQAALRAIKSGRAVTFNG